MPCSTSTARSPLWYVLVTLCRSISGTSSGARWRPAWGQESGVAFMSTTPCSAGRAGATEAARAHARRHATLLLVALRVVARAAGRLLQAGDHLLALVQARDDLHLHAVGDAQLDLAFLDVAVRVDHLHGGAARAALYRCRSKAGADRRTTGRRRGGIGSRFRVGAAFGAGACLARCGGGRCAGCRVGGAVVAAGVVASRPVATHARAVSRRATAFGT